MNRTVNRTIDIIQFISENPSGVSMRSLLEYLEIPKSSAFDIIRTLADRNIIREIPGQPLLYAPGIQLYISGSSYTAGMPLMQESIQLLREVAERTHRNAYMGAIDGDRLVYIYKYKPGNSILTAAGIGEHKNLHCTALGKILVAYQSPEDCQRLCDRLPLPRRSSRTITGREEFHREIDLSRQRGYSLDLMENDEHTFCVSAPVLNADGVAEMAVSLSYLYSDSIDIQADAREIMGIARRLSRQLGFSSE